jgi:glycosyltransferase involved in cell wall biosynthesis
MRIAVLNWRDAAHPDAGGAEVFVHEITRRWAADGHRVSLHSSQWSRGSSHDEIDGVEVVRTGRLRSLGHHIAAPRTVLGYGRPHGIVESINTIPYLMPWRSRGAPFISLVHQLARDVWRSHLPAPAAFAARALERALYMPYRTVPTLAVSESTKADLLSVGLSDVRVIPQGGLGVQPLREKAATPTLVFVGRLASNKRPDHAVEAFREVKRSFPEARFWIVGTGEMSEPLRAALPDGVGEAAADRAVRPHGQSASLACDVRARGVGPRCNGGQRARHPMCRIRRPGTAGLGQARRYGMVDDAGSTVAGGRGQGPHRASRAVLEAARTSHRVGANLYVG